MLILLIGGADYRLLTHNPKIPVLREKTTQSKYRSTDEIWPFPTFQEWEEESTSCLSNVCFTTCKWWGNQGAWESKGGLAEEIKVEYLQMSHMIIVWVYLNGETPKIWLTVVIMFIKRTDIHSWATGTSVWLLVNTKIIQISQSQESSSMHLGM